MNFPVAPGPLPAIFSDQKWKQWMQQFLMQALQGFSSKVQITSEYSQVQKAIEDVLQSALSVIDENVASPSQQDDQQSIKKSPPIGVDWELQFVHQCQAVGCADPNCYLCEQNPVRQCDTPLQKKFYVKDYLQSRCGATVELELRDKGTGQLVTSVPQLSVELSIFDANKLQWNKTKQAPPVEMIEALQLLNNQHGLPLITPGKNMEALEDGKVVMRLINGKGELKDMSVTDSSEALLKGRRPPFKLFANPLLGKNEKKYNIQGTISNGFVVATGRSRQAGKAEVPRIDDPVGKLEHIGKETVRKLNNLQAASQEVGIGLEELPPIYIQRVGDFKQLALKAEADSSLRHKLQKLLKLSEDKWEEAREHAQSAVSRDCSLRVWYEDVEQLRGVLYACNQGDINLDRPAGLLIKDGRGFEKAVRVEEMDIQQRQVLQQLQPQAKETWWKEKHPGWAMLQADSETFLQSGRLMLNSGGGGDLSPAVLESSPIGSALTSRKDSFGSTRQPYALTLPPNIPGVETSDKQRDLVGYERPPPQNFPQIYHTLMQAALARANNPHHPHPHAPQPHPNPLNDPLTHFSDRNNKLTEAIRRYEFAHLAESRQKPGLQDPQERQIFNRFQALPKNNQLTNFRDERARFLNQSRFLQQQHLQNAQNPSNLRDSLFTQFTEKDRLLFGKSDIGMQQNNNTLGAQQQQQIQIQQQQQQLQQQQQKFQRSPIQEPVIEPVSQEQGVDFVPPRHPFQLQTNQISNSNNNNNNSNNNNANNNNNDGNGENFGSNNNDNNSNREQQQLACESQPSLNWSIRNDPSQNEQGVEKSLGLGLGIEKGGLSGAKRPTSPMSNPPPAKKNRKNNNFTSPFVMAASQGNGAESNISKPQSTESISNGNFQEDPNLPKSDSLGDFNFTPSMEEFGRMDTQDLLRQCAIGNSGLFPVTSSAAYQNFQDPGKIQSFMNVLSSEFPDFKSFSIGLFSSLMQSAILPQNENDNYRNHEIQEEGEDDGSGGIPTPMRNDIQGDQIEGTEGSLNDGNVPGNALIKEELE